MLSLWLCLTKNQKLWQTLSSKKWICRHGCGDWSRKRVLWSSYWKLAVRHNTTTAHHPQCNSQAEVANKTIAKYLASFVDSSTLKGEDLLSPSMFSYNTSFHFSVKATPSYLTFGIEPRQPGFEQPEVRRKFYGESSTDELFKRQHLARDIARRNRRKLPRREKIQKMSRNWSTTIPTYCSLIMIGSETHRHLSEKIQANLTVKF